MLLTIQTSRTITLPSSSATPPAVVGYFQTWEDYIIFALFVFFRYIKISLFSYHTDNARPHPPTASRHLLEFVSQASFLTPKSPSALSWTITTHRIIALRLHQSLTPSHTPLRPTSTGEALSSIAFEVSTGMSRDLLRFLLTPLQDTTFPPLPWEERLHRLLHLVLHSSDLSLLPVNEPTPQLRSSKKCHHRHPLFRGNNRKKRCSFYPSSSASTSRDTSRGATCRICGIAGRARTPCR